uniref:Centrosomal protein 112 n=1 Tax=Leptobrachium leishanense TaxID=445787 RepID=A0A8C5R7N9_9ANUR
MSNQEDTWERLDAEFDHYLVDMKPYVLKLHHKTERQRCALWIKKLCDPSSAGTGITGRRNRNLYAKLLLHMLRREALEGPFTHKPEEGSLKTLPTYMSIYFDEPNPPRFQSTASGGLLDWVVGELEDRVKKSDDHWRSSLKEETPQAASTSREKYFYSQKQSSRSMSPTRRLGEDNLFALRTDDPLKTASVSFDDSDLEARLNSWNLGIEKPRYLREKPITLSPLSSKSGLGKSSTYQDEHTISRLQQKKELDMKTKGMEVKFHEEKLRMQQKHDADVQKILDRKNSEIEELKTMYKGKQNESDETIHKLEKKIQTLVRESQVMRENKETQITELKKMCEKSTDSLKNEWEKKLHNAMADMEQEKFEMQKKHTETIQELLDDTNARLLKMESDYVAQTRATEQTVKELEARVQQLTVEAESSNLHRQRLSQEKAELEKSYQASRDELQVARQRLETLQNERNLMSKEYEKQIQQLQSKFESDMSFITQQNALSAGKASELIEDLEQHVSRLKLQLQESELKRQQQLRETENRFQEEKFSLDRVNDRKIHDLRKQMDNGKSSSDRKIGNLEAVLKEKEEQLARVVEMQRVQAQQADAALEEFKRQVELNTEKVYSEMRQQMEKVEADLSRSKSLREKQSKEFTRQIEELKQRYEQQIVELKLEHEEEKTYLFQQHSTEKDGIIKDHEKEMDRLEKQLRSTLSDHETKTQQWRQRDSQTISELEAQVYRLKEELIQVNSQRKQQLVELALLRDEEKQKNGQEHQQAMSKLRAEMETMKLDHQKAHASKMEEAVEKANSRLKQIEKEYSEKLTKSTQVISELQATVTTTRQQSSLHQVSMERRLKETYEEEKRQLIKENEKVIQLLKKEVESYCSQLRGAEMKIQEREIFMQEQVTQIRQEYELKLKGMMPTAMRQELEDTIKSLKSQVTFLQKRVDVLQFEHSSSQNKRP